MKTIINTKRAGKSIVTSLGTWTFDLEGKSVVSDEYAESVKEREGFIILPDEDDQKSLLNNENAPDEGNTSETENQSGDVQETSESGEEDKTKEDSDEDDKDTSETDVANDSLDKMNVMSLKKMAKEQGIDISGLTKKDQLIAAIRAQ